MFQDLYWCETRLYHVPLAFQCLYGCSNKRKENGDREYEMMGEGVVDCCVKRASCKYIRKWAFLTWTLECTLE